MAEETWEQKWAREEKERAAKAKKAWAIYQADKTRTLLEKRRDRRDKEWVYDYQDWVKETESERRVKTTRFTVHDSGKVSMWSTTSKSQKFLCVNGPLAGKRVVQDVRVEPKTGEYKLYNTANREYPDKGDIPQCVLVHRDSLK